MRIKKKVKLKKRIFLLMALGIMVPLAFSSFKNISFAMPVLGTDKESKSTLINEYINNLSNLVEKKDIDSRFVNVISLEDDRYISKLFNFKNGKEVSIESIIKPEMVEEFWAKVNTLLYLKYPNFISDVLSKNDKTNTYFIKDNELVIYYYDYEIEPLPNEELSLHINYNEIKDYMDITIKLDKTYENEDGSKIDLNKKIGLYSYIIIGFSGVFILMIIIMIALAKKRSGKQKKQKPIEKEIKKNVDEKNVIEEIT